MRLVGQHTHRCPVPALVAMTGHDKSASCSCSPWPAAQPGPGQAREETTSQPPGHRARAAARAPFCRRRYGSNHVPSSFPFTTIPYTYVAWPLRIRLPPSCRSRPYGRCERTFFFLILTLFKNLTSHSFFKANSFDHVMHDGVAKPHCPTIYGGTARPLGGSQLT